MKNAEKYAEQIAEIISEMDQCPRTFNERGEECDSSCALSGICNSKDDMKEWLLQEVDE